MGKCMRTGTAVFVCVTVLVGVLAVAVLVGVRVPVAGLVRVGVHVGVLVLVGTDVRVGVQLLVGVGVMLEKRSTSNPASGRTGGLRMQATASRAPDHVSRRRSIE